MLRNYLKIVFRYLVKNKTYSIINIGGLAIGMACTILILMWINYELSYDGFHKNKNQIFWAAREFDNPNGTKEYSPVTVLPLAKALTTEYPEIKKAARFNDAFGEFPLRFNDKVFYANGAPTDQDFFEIFTFPFCFGTASTVYQNPNSLVLTKSTAEKFFGNKNPVGKTLQFELWGKWWDFEVTGVMENIPANSDFHFDFLFPISFLNKLGWDETNWMNGCVKTYILTRPGSNATELTKKIADINHRHNSNAEASIILYPLSKIHLYNLDGSARITYIYIFLIIAVFILVISCVNFVNLSTARYEKRAKEIGVKKAAGASRIQLGGQFLVESILFSLMALLLAIIIVELSITFYSRLISNELQFQYSGSMFLWSIIIASIVGVVSGIYPSVVLSSVTTIDMFKGAKSGKGNNRSASLRKILVGFQFTLSIILIIGVIVVRNQLSFVKSKPLGFDKNHVIHVALRSDLRDPGKFITIKNNLLSNSAVTSMTACNSNFTQWQFSADEKEIGWEGKKPNDKIEMEVNSVDQDFLKTFNMKMVKGRFFSTDFPTDINESVIINETAIKALGLKNPVGQQFEYHGKRHIVGVIKDFNFYSLHQQVKPLILFVAPYWYHSLYIKIHGDELAKTIQFIERTIKQSIPDYPFVYSFLDDDLNKSYKVEQNIENILTVFSALAILISCLGILGLITFVTERRTKEIGIRKVLGASVPGVVYLLTKDFMKWIILANIIAWPVAYYLMNNWLQDFAYRIDISWWIFVLSGGIALMIALATVSFQAIKAAVANPIESLRYE
jgi:putative ABC transport system permease protein